MNISTLVCTRNRQESLARCIEHLFNIEFDKSWEIVVVNNGSTDGTSALLEELATRSPVPFVLLYEPRTGLSRARNVGVKAARGDIICFTDDDCYVQADYLSKVHEAFLNSSLGYITGRINLYNPAHYKATINESTIPIGLCSGTYIAPGVVKGANMAFRRSVLDDIGPFDEMLGAGTDINSGEDTDIASRASLAGWLGLYDPLVVVSHDHGRTSLDIGPLLRSYAIGRGAFHAKLLLTAGARRHGLIGWARLALRGVRRPYIVYWEFLGAIRYIRKRLSTAN